MDTINKTAIKIASAIIHCYRYIVSPLLAPSCRHLPTCSEYSLECIKRHGLFRGAWHSIKRIIRCRPGGTSGYDPIPKKETNE